jgi:hypothetical protein
VEVTRNGAPLSQGHGRDVQGNPAQAVAWLANALGEYGVSLDAGDIILSGSMVPLTDAVPVTASPCRSPAWAIAPLNLSEETPLWPRVKAAIIGSGNIGTDLMMKMIKYPQNMELAAVVGIDPASEGLAMARERGIATTHEGIEGLRSCPAIPKSASPSMRPALMPTRRMTRRCARTGSGGRPDPRRDRPLHRPPVNMSRTSTSPTSTW